MRPSKRYNPQEEGFFGTKGFINPRARTRQIGSSEFSLERMIRDLGYALKERERRKEAEEAEEAEGELYSSGEATMGAFDDGSGGGKQCVINDDGEIDCTGEPTGGASAYGGFGPARGAKSESFGDILIALANRAGDRKIDRQKANKNIARYFEDRSQFGARNPDTDVVNNPLMLALARYFDRRSQKIKSKRDGGSSTYGGSYSF